MNISIVMAYYNRKELLYNTLKSIEHYWPDRDVDNLKLKNIELYDSINNNAQKSDLLRYEILSQYGGIYVDTDFECIKSFDDLMHLDFFTSIAYRGKLELYIGLLASVPNHPILTKCIESMKTVADETWVDIFNTTGTYYFTKCFFDVVHENTEKVVAFPMDYFYPFPNNRRFIKNRIYRNLFIKDFSYAIHHWEVSWIAQFS